MTIFFPDVSEYTPDVNPAGYPALLARATLSDRVADPTYAGFKAKAAAAGTVFGAYHWLNHGNIRNQAQWCFDHVGPQVPVMIDAEDEPGNTGYNGPLTVDDLLAFANEYRALSGIVSLCYLPFWYWSGAMGAPRRLGELAAARLGLVSSNYPNAGYTDNGPGWAPYYPGAPAPVQWQYTDAPIDMNAFKGTAADYAALIGVPQVEGESTEVTGMPFLASEDATGRVFLCTDDFKSHYLPDPKIVGDILALHYSGARPLGTRSDTAPEGQWSDWGTSKGVIRNGWYPGAFGLVAEPAISPTSAQVDAAVAAVMNDPAWLAKLAAALPTQPAAPTAAEVPKTADGHAAARAQE